MVPEAGDTAAPVICVDGPGGSGKSTLARELAESMGWHHLDSGALYRFVAANALAQGVGLDDEPALAGLASSLPIAAGQPHPQSHGEPGSAMEDIRSERVGAAASTIAAYPQLRAAILDRQRASRRPPGLVADGRDMGTVVFPDAELKIFLDATAEIRAERRNKQLKNKGLNVNFRALLAGIRERDARDRKRAAAPLRAADDAVVIDSTEMGLDEVIAQAMVLARARGLMPDGHRA